MLPLWNSQRPLLGDLREHQCPRCHQEVELPLGELCRSCRRALERRAARVANLVSMVSTAVVATYIVLRLRHIRATPDGMIDLRTARMVGVASIVVWFALSNAVTRRVMRHWMR